MAGLGVYNAPVYNEAVYNDGTGAVSVAVERPRQVAISGRPISRLIEVDPILLARPEAAALRQLQRIQRQLEYTLRE